MPGYVRFVVAATDSDSGVRQGIFQVAYGVLKDHRIGGTSYDRLRSLMDWFNDHLEQPGRFSRGPAPSGRGISWFKDSAPDHIRRAFEVRSILSEVGVEVEVITTQRPGYVIYEDSVQVVADPFSDTGA